MEFNDEAEMISTDDPLHDLFYGGYIVPKLLLKDRDEARKVEDAMSLITQFISEAEDAGVLEIF